VEKGSARQGRQKANGRAARTRPEKTAFDEVLSVPHTRRMMATVRRLTERSTPVVTGFSVPDIDE
jgi:hypothetical protein